MNEETKSIEEQINRKIDKIAQASLEIGRLLDAHNERVRPSVARRQKNADSLHRQADALERIAAVLEKMVK